MKKNPTMVIVVAAALRSAEGKILLQKRPEGRKMAGLWEFPGGKIEEGESPEQALVRELNEELAIDVAPAKLAPLCFASAPLDSKKLLLLLYLCDEWRGDAQPIESPQLGWFALSEMRELAMPPADIPLLDLLEKILA
jgi:8-oxo-dGTP diphosphatase